jgi:hypothetical protein
MSKKQELIDYVIGNEFITKPSLQEKFTYLLDEALTEQLILSGVSKCLNEQTLENINNIMWESHMIKSKTFDKTQGTMIMQELEKWAGR